MPKMWKTKNTCGDSVMLRPVILMVGSAVSSGPRAPPGSGLQRSAGGQEDLVQPDAQLHQDRHWDQGDHLTREAQSGSTETKSATSRRLTSPAGPRLQHSPRSHRIPVLFVPSYPEEVLPVPTAPTDRTPPPIYSPLHPRVTPAECADAEGLQNRDTKYNATHFPPETQRASSGHGKKSIKKEEKEDALHLFLSLNC